jgi:hypothetical protein
MGGIATLAFAARNPELARSLSGVGFAGSEISFDSKNTYVHI